MSELVTKEPTEPIDCVDKQSFTPLLVSTTTVTSMFKCQVNIVDIAKYLPLDDVVIGIKLVYAGGTSSIIRGVAKMSKKKKDFYNQVTFTIRLPVGSREKKPATEQTHMANTSILVSCKIFHNGTLHVTGTHTLEEAARASNFLLERLERFQGVKMVSLMKNEPYLAAHDNLLYNSAGNIIGWHKKEDEYGESDKRVIYLKNEYVNLDMLTFGHGNNNNCEEKDDKTDQTNISSLEQTPVFVSGKWVNNGKCIYTLDGEIVGRRILHFNQHIIRRHFDVKFGYIYAGNKIVGKEVIEFEKNYVQMLTDCEKYRRYLVEKGALIHGFNSFSTCKTSFADVAIPVPFVESAFCTHMINMFFKAPFKICRKRLHKTFLDNDYYSRFDPCSNAAVNLRFHYNPVTMAYPKERGKCSLVHKRTCHCKDISVSCFNSGKMNVTGLATLEQGQVVYDFLRDFFIRERKKIYSE